MNTNNVLNAGLQTIATGLVALGAATIAGNLITGAVEIVLGVVVYVIYERFPS